MSNNKIGVMICYDYGVDLYEKFKKNRELSIYSCQLCIWNVDIFKDVNLADTFFYCLSEVIICKT